VNLISASSVDGPVSVPLFVSALHDSFSPPASNALAPLVLVNPFLMGASPLPLTIKGIEAAEAVADATALIAHTATRASTIIPIRMSLIRCSFDRGC
jgi:hypothetical protein